MRRRLPVWIAGGPEVSTLAYQIVCVAFGNPPARISAPALDTRPFDLVGTGRVVAHLCDVLDADEADVLRAMAELERAGVFVKDDPKARQP
jgi:hypothetical protein